MKIGILQTGHVPDTLQAENGDYDKIFPQFLAGQGLEFDAYAVVDNIFPDGPHAADGWLITGSRHGAYEDHPWIPPLEALIREIFAADIPLVGICFGHQIIAQALGGKVEKFDGGWAVGRTSYDLAGQTVQLNAWHQDQVTQVPEGARVIGQNDFCTNAALLYGNRIFTLQPHPEINSTYLGGLLHERAPGLVPAPLIDTAVADLDQPTDSATLAAQIARFFRDREFA